MSLSGKYELLLEVASRSPVAIAFSGGVDSSLLLKAAADVHGSSTMALFADSVFQPPGELENARSIAELIGCDFRVIQVEPLSIPVLAANPPDRCYHCKKEIYTTFLSFLPDPEYILMDGSNLDDLDTHRPGRKAVSELGVHTPLVEASLCKDEIRQLAREMSLPNWNKLSASCLATRLPAGMRINNERLDLVARCESVLHGFGFYGCRVRLVPGSEKEVRLELIKNDLEKFSDTNVRGNVLKELSPLGVERIFLDPAGR